MTASPNLGISGHQIEPRPTETCSILPTNISKSKGIAIAGISMGENWLESRDLVTSRRMLEANSSRDRLHGTSTILFVLEPISSQTNGGEPFQSFVYTHIEYW